MTTITPPRTGLYVCSRASSWYTKPCDNAFEINVRHVDTRDVDDPSKLVHYDGAAEEWFAKGTNHRVVDGHICRDLAVKVWAVEILDIIDFVKEHGQCVVSINKGGFPEIEIYDTYRE